MLVKTHCFSVNEYVPRHQSSHSMKDQSQIEKVPAVRWRVLELDGVVVSQTITHIVALTPVRC